MSLFKKKKKCDHAFTIDKTSNAIQLDDMGHPLMLCICRCINCGFSKQEWIDVSVESVNNAKIINDDSLFVFKLYGSK